MFDFKLSPWEQDESGGYTESIGSINKTPIVMLRAVKNGKDRYEAVVRRVSNGHVVAMSQKDFATQGEAQNESLRLLALVKLKALKRSIAAALLILSIPQKPRFDPANN